MTSPNNAFECPECGSKVLLAVNGNTDRDELVECCVCYIGIPVEEWLELRYCEHDRPVFKARCRECDILEGGDMAYHMAKDEGRL